MQLNFVDFSVIILYLACMIGIGIAMRIRAARGVSSYFLGQRELPWWMLAASGSSSYFDITGTMWIVSLIYIMGMRAMWVQWMWGFLITVFFAVYMGKWINRSAVITGAEWMKTRFGEESAGETARLAYALLAVVTTVAFLAYDAVGIGKFAQVYLPFSRDACAAIILGATGIYIIIGGFYSVILTDFVQTIILSCGALIIAYLGFAHAGGEFFSKVSGEWFTLTPQWTIPSLKEIAEGQYYLFGALLIVWVVKGLLLSAGGPQQLYDFQRFLSAKNSRDASKLGALWGILHTIRWPMAMGITVLALVGFAGATDPETVLPLVISKYLPIGIRGIVFAALLAAFMSTFSSTVNAGASYLVRDLYQRWINPAAKEKTLVYAGYLSSTLLIILGIVIGTQAKSIAQVFNWIMVSLGAGVVLPNFLRWYWWRLNGWGFTAGVISGIISSLVQVICFSSAPIYVYFPVLIGIGLIVSVMVSLLTKPTEERRLIEFYKIVQPCGFWKPITDKIRQIGPEFRKETPFAKDLVNIILGLPWMLCLYLWPMYLIIHQYRQMWACLGVNVILGIGLYFTWYKNLPIKK